MTKAIRTKDRYEIPFTPTVDTEAGVVLLIGATVAVNINFCPANKPGRADPAFQGRFPKVGSQVQAQGALLYWDNTAKNLTTTASGNTLCARVVEAAASADTTVHAMLYPA
jgi:predicted RecA/RadA family phage recombinase